MIALAVTRVVPFLCLSFSVLLLVPDIARAQLRLTTFVSGLNLPVGFVQDPGIQRTNTLSSRVGSSG